MLFSGSVLLVTSIPNGLRALTYTSPHCVYMLEFQLFSPFVKAMTFVDVDGPMSDCFKPVLNDEARGVRFLRFCSHRSQCSLSPAVSQYVPPMSL